MLAQILAVLVGTGSVGLYIAAFFFPEIHRKQDFIWSGVGFFYALSLWIYARQTTGGILVGETASVALLGWFVWQTLKLRRQLVPTNQQTPIPTTTQIKQQLGLKQTGIKIAKSNPATVPTATAPAQAKSSAPTTPVTPPPVTAVPAPVVTPIVHPAAPVAVATSTVVREQRQQPTTTPFQPIPTVIPPTQQVPVTRAQPQQSPAIPAAPPIPAVPASVVPPVARAVIPVPVDVPKQPQSPTVPPAKEEDREAWIKLEVKPSSTPAKPLGQPAKPPTTVPTQLPAIASESVARNIPTEAEISVKLDSAQS